MKRVRLLLSLLAGAVLLASALVAEASHERFHHATWVPRPDLGPTSVEITVKHAWRRSACGGTAGDGFVAVGDPACQFNALLFGDGNSTGITGTVVSIDPVDDWYLATYSTTHTYADVNNGGVPWLVQAPSCCRIYGTVNAPGTSFDIQATIDLSLSNSSPLSTIFPIVLMARDAVNTIPLPIADVDGDAVACRFATFAESGSGIASQPAATFPLTIGSDCVLSWDTAGTATGQLWATQIVIEESRGGNPSHGRVALEFIIEIVDSVGDPPVCDVPPTPTGTISIPVGTSYTATVQGSDPDAGDTLTLNSTGIPAGATLTPPLPTSSGSPVSSVFSWTPTAADAGAHPLLFSITDQNNLQALCSFTFAVSVCGDGITDFGEQCDDGNTDNSDGCKNDCTLNVCGDGVLFIGVEQCDDGNTTDGDGCTAQCLIETPPPTDLCADACAKPEALHVDAANHPLVGTPGSDILCGDGRKNILRGQAGDDILCGLGGNDFLQGANGSDYLDGGEGNDTLRGGDGDDELVGGAGNDALLDDAGDDSLDGGPGDDVLRDDRGNDTLLGGEDKDRLYSGRGDDSLDGGDGDDFANGGTGTDTCLAERTVKCP